ncbi:MAG: TonB-dependent receptor [Bacteroidota bacterium]
MIKQLILGLVGLLMTLPLIAQNATIHGVVMDGVSGDYLPGATLIRDGSTQGTTTDYDGNYVLSVPAGEHTLVLHYTGYESRKQKVNLQPGEEKELNWNVNETPTLLDVATVTSGRYEKPLGEVTVSLEVIKPSLIDNSNQRSLDGVLEKIPGVNVTDGQPSIRGGSGYSYGAGSRVLLLVDDIPILASDAGFPNWDDVPIENIEQVEVVKGAASALYGSSAMNGIINVRTGYAKSEPETSFSTFGRLYSVPEIESAGWWKDNDEVFPYETGTSLRHARKLGKLDMVLSGYYYNQRSYLRDGFRNYGRFTTSWRYRASDRLSFQVNSNYNKGSNRNFFYWAGIDSLLYTAAPNTLTLGSPRRYNIDPSITYYTKDGDRHRLLSRYYNVFNRNSGGRDNQSELFYGEYQFQRRFANSNIILTAGAVAQGTSVSAELYGDTTYSSRNFAGYLQLEKKFFDRLNISVGARYEYNALDSPEEVAGEIIPDGRTTESKPVFRFGANYRAAEFTYLRASWGQGYRYPTVAEKFILTDVGGILISPNPALESETGWTAEIGIKQGFKIGGFAGFADLSAFWSEYQNMMEFSFENLFITGFQSLNVGDTRTTGFELSIGGQGRLFGGTTSVIGGVTIIDPQFKDWDPNIPGAGEPRTQGQRNVELSTSDENILKYRNRQSAKLDIETQWGNFSLGLAGIYNSRIENIDWIFEALIVPGLAEWRANETGALVTNARAAYRFGELIKLSLLVDNMTNEAYSLRPGLLAAPRSTALRLDVRF